MGSRGCLIWSTEAAALHRGLGGAVRLALGGTPPPHAGGHGDTTCPPRWKTSPETFQRMASAQTAFFNQKARKLQVRCVKIKVRLGFSV